jgi:hypothetical protein
MKRASNPLESEECTLCSYVLILNPTALGICLTIDMIGILTLGVCARLCVSSLSCRGVAATVIVLSLGGPARGRRSGQGLPRHFSGFLARLFKVAIVSPEVCAILAAVYEDAAGPCCPDACCLSQRQANVALGGEGCEPRGSE